jgi:hypothetical protein
MQFRRVFNACRIQRLRLWQKQLQEAWSIIKPLITLGTDKTRPSMPVSPHLVDGQVLLRIGLLEIDRPIKQRQEPYNTKLWFVEYEVIGGSLE